MSAPTTTPSRPAPQVATPGPWTATRSDPSRGADVWHITACPAPNQEKDICDVPGGPYQEANARLIAAAPAMRDALQAIVREFGDRPWLSFPKTSALLAARSALAIAQGAAPAGGEG
jgi:hypothetical protein